MFNPMSLVGKRILVTGASSGIGRACAIMAAQLGASVILVGRDKGRLERVVHEIGLTGNIEYSPVCYLCNVTDPDSVSSLAREVSTLGKIDGLVHSAGICQAVPLRVQEIADLRMIYETNVLSLVYFMRHFATRRMANPGFSAVAISSVAARAGSSGYVAYSGSKGGVEATVRSMAIELASQKFRVNAVAPANIQTPMLDRLMNGIDHEKVIADIQAKQPLGLGKPEDVAASVCFLLSPAAGFITGVSLPVDGGYLAR